MKKLFIYFTLSIFLITILMQLIAEPLLFKIYEDEIIAYYRHIGEAPLTMISDNMLNMNEEERAAYINKYEGKFEFPVTIVKLSSIKESERKLLEEGFSLADTRGEIYKKRIHDTDDVLVFGPTNSNLERILLVVTYGLLIAIIILVTFILSFIVWRDITKLRNAVAKFGEGDFNSQIKIRKASFVSSISVAFNNMATRIKTLINSHKDLTNAVAHELRTPLTRMRFELEKIKDEVKDEKSLEGVYTDLDELDNLITELLTYSRLDRKEDILNLEKVDIAEFVNGYCSGIRPLYSKDFSWNVGKSCEGLEINIDKKLIVMALNNLVMNAFKYSKSNVSIIAFLTDSKAVIDVTDDGEGMSNEAIEEIFKPFKRLDSSRNKETGGFGLGLAVVAKIIELHNWQINVETSQGKGTVFRITINLA